MLCGVIVGTSSNSHKHYFTVGSYHELSCPYGNNCESRRLFVSSFRCIDQMQKNIRGKNLRLIPFQWLHRSPQLCSQFNLEWVQRNVYVLCMYTNLNTTHVFFMSILRLLTYHMSLKCGYPIMTSDHIDPHILSCNWCGICITSQVPMLGNYKILCGPYE